MSSQSILLLCLLLAPFTLLSAQTNEACNCDTWWKADPTVAFIDLLEKATAGHAPFWGEYYLGKGAIVLEAGQLPSGENCLGVWKNSKNIAYACVEDKPQMLTPLFTYYLNYDTIDQKLNPLVAAKNQSPHFHQWMQELGIESAVYMPTDFPNFPFELSALKKTQLAVHELFHVEVQFPVWFTQKGYWPLWDVHPDRPGVPVCYTASEKVTNLMEQELAQLADVVEALLEEKEEQVCTAGQLFLNTRKQRYLELVDTTVALHDGSPGSCYTVESLMEIEEGLADYASWTQLYEVGLVTQEQIVQRYRTQQKDKYYLSGNMLMHAIALMNDGKTTQVIDALVNADSLEEGALLRLFENHLANYCKSKN